MIYKGSKEISTIYYGKKAVMYVYRGGKIVWQAISSCFGAGYWKNDFPWKNEDAWKN